MGLQTPDGDAEGFLGVTGLGGQLAPSPLGGDVGGHAARLGHLLGQAVLDLDELGLAQICTRAGFISMSTSF